ncbi:hypothetical protein [Streptomyces sp. NPDC017991]|uniref:hypothetical protein n=1 Tax=Streptomyces sp. NPDC017991 TaxID=3365026 RepID=UPI0037ACB172
MSWTRALLTALAVCALFGALLVGATGCGSDGAREDDEVRPSPVGRVLKDTDEEGRHYREIDKKSAPEVEIEIQPAVDGGGDGDGGGGAEGEGDDGWEVRLTVHDFRFSPAATEKKAVRGRGYALLRLDDRPLSLLRGPNHHLAGDVVPRGTHQVTVRLHADDDTVWAVDGEPVASTADITVSDPGPTTALRPTAAGPSGWTTALGGSAPAASPAGGWAPTAAATLSVACPSGEVASARAASSVGGSCRAAATAATAAAAGVAVSVTVPVGEAPLTAPAGHSRHSAPPTGAALSVAPPVDGPPLLTAGPAAGLSLSADPPGAPAGLPAPADGVPRLSAPASLATLAGVPRPPASAISGA